MVEDNTKVSAADVQTFPSQIIELARRYLLQTTVGKTLIQAGSNC